MFSIIVLLHEYGHYKTARIFWIHIEEFGLWIPPRAKKLWRNKAGTLFSLNWIPLGWFVKIAGESEIFISYYTQKWKLLTQKWLIKKLSSNEELYNKKWIKITKQERKFIKDRLQNQKKWQNFYEKNIFIKSAVLLAGVIMNFLLAVIIFSFLFFIWVKPVWINTFIETDVPSKIIPSYNDAISQGILIENDGIVLFPVEWSLAESSWIMQWDILTEINGQSITSIKMSQDIIQNSKNQDITFTVTSAQCNSTWECTSYYMDKQVQISVWDDGRIGSYLSPNITQNEDFFYKYWFIDSIRYGILETYAQIRLTFSGLWILATNIINPENPQDREQALDSVAGPIGIVWVITESMERWFTILIILAAIISINLWVFNLLPIPALDWGRFVILWIRSCIDKIFWKSRLSWDIENLSHILFFILLIALSIIIAYNDIIKIFTE